jgi:hypothetical protein
MISESSSEFSSDGAFCSSNSSEKKETSPLNFLHQLFARFLLWLRRVFGGQSASSKTT